MIDFKQQKKETAEVLLASEAISTLNKNDIQDLIQFAEKNTSKKVRFCSHQSPDELMQEMFIVHPKDVYVRPHKHLDRVESILILQGEVDYILFDDSGNIEKIIKMGDNTTGKNFYASVRDKKYHSFIIKSDWLVFLEITTGPFDKTKSVFAPWSPEDKNSIEVKNYMSKLKEKRAKRSDFE